IIITGAASGIGKATALLLGIQGARLGLLDINSPEDVAKEIGKRGGTATAYQCDITSSTQVEETVRSFVNKFGPLTGAANLAGVMPKTAGAEGSSFLNENDSEWQRVLTINVDGVRNCMRAELRHFHPDGCSIVNASSLAGQMPSPNNSLYAMSKAAVISLTLSVAHEFGRKGVRINAIAPGIVETAMVGFLTEQHKVAANSRNALGRSGTAQEVAELISFLLSDKSSFCTGTV
ncbi:short-chain dehydrogenase/reductase SDR, partial [Phaeosphaeriaceae sp. PMI808]